MKKIDFMLTAFRDGFQSVYGARVFSKDYLPVVQACAEAGIKHFESGGGAMFQSPYFYSNEDSFKVMDDFRAAAGPEANLQTLARGINVVGLDSQSSDVIKLHAQLFKKHGVTTIRNFDALNDVNNLIFSGKCIKEAGLRHEVTVTMMELPPGCEGAHTAGILYRRPQEHSRRGHPVRLGLLQRPLRERAAPKRYLKPSRRRGSSSVPRRGSSSTATKPRVPGP